MTADTCHNPPSSMPGSSWLDSAAIDWNAVWRHQMRLRRENGARECAALWQRPDHARRYLEAMRANNPEYFANTVEAVHLEPHFNVLDIGAGPGTMALPMARRAARLTAVEPAAGMADLIEARCRNEGIGNIRCIRKRWQELDPEADLDGSYDVVVAAFSLGVDDLQSAIEKMNRVCHGMVYLFWFVGASTWEQLYRNLWPKLHGRPYHPGPKADVIFNLLYRMYIYPDTTVFPFRSRLRFAVFEEAVEEFGHRLGVAEPHTSCPLRAFLDAQLQRDGTDLVLPHEATCVRFAWPARG